MLHNRTLPARLRWSVPIHVLQFCLTLLLVCVLPACGRLFPLKASGTPATLPDTVATATPRAVPPVILGAAVSYDHLRNDTQYRETIRQYFNMLVPENEMKFEELEPKRGVFDFSRADALVGFARVNGLWVRGHTLVWGEQLPAWLTEGSFTRDELSQILKTYIETVVGHYRGRVIAWDVVNESFAGDQLRENFWLQHLGPDYIRDAFLWAHEADPQAKLFYNDYGAEEPGPKFDAILQLMTKLRAQGVPISGVGMEMHLGFGAPPDAHAVEENMQRLRKAGLEVAVTEMDVQIVNLPGLLDTKLREQATIYGEIATACRTAGNCHYFATWGVSDRYSWIPQFTGHADAPLLFDTSYRPKPAYYAVHNALPNSPPTS